MQSITDINLRQPTAQSNTQTHYHCVANDSECPIYWFSDM